MNNSSLTSADSATHLKVVIVSLLAGIVVVGVGILAKPNFSDGTATASRMEAQGPVIRATKSTAVAGDTRNVR
jgi:Flp pilus assembly protein TadG